MEISLKSIPSFAYIVTLDVTRLYYSTPSSLHKINRKTGRGQLAETERRFHSKSRQHTLPKMDSQDYRRYSTRVVAKKFLLLNHIKNDSMNHNCHTIVICIVYLCMPCIINCNFVLLEMYML